MKIEISQQQKQILSPMILQTLELLTLPTLDLVEKLEEESEKNPLIELEYQKESEERETPGEIFEKEHLTDIESENAYQDSSDSGLEPRSKTQKSSSDFDQQSYLENFSTEHFDLYESFMEQIRFLDFPQRDTHLAQLILTGLDSNGFLVLAPRELLEDSDFSEDEFESVRQRILKLDPPGIASKNIREFLLLQIEDLYGKDSVEYRIINEFSTLLERKQYTKISKKLNLSYKEVENIVSRIKNLQIYPNLNFQKEKTRYIIPDANVQIINGNIQVILNDEYIPKVKLNQYYIDLAKNSHDPKTRSFLKNDVTQAKILIENLNSRKEIIFKVIVSIIEKQKDFFLKGEQYQIPLKLKDIAEELEIHESTVSRAIKEKYIQTEKGIIALKRFFSTQVGTKSTSSNSIKEILKTVIEAEDKNEPLSDEKIVRIFQNKGIAVSRRTLAKYRAVLDIPAAYIRKNPV